MSTKRMVYVAADPTQPGAAWAIAGCAEPGDTVWRKELAKTLAEWISQGADVMLVEHMAGCDMMDKWVRPSKADTTQGSLL
jgi:hypothetical protein